ncbi:Gfo/Idh/MocA family protein [Roseibium litorale]|uniref:Gfo/Idh/MocA family oxidoreductase n=1 Tax=Roseibium litorale TaxID=2803841 RepID=A0ABR9CSN8_9HYPH|nr:Gfo/Idh/MocA family oxidoreductase [Roseibium litorale]MBD8893897.1 Gfo/Idh/MocA family oxidoreductase [Roseibium litorale]
MSSKVRVAVIGAGIGKAHVSAYAELPELFEVRAVCDLNPVRAAEAAQLAPGAKAVTSFEQVCADPEIDLVDICLPPQLHAQMTLAAQEAGKHAVCEKPLAGSIDDVQKMKAVAARTGKRVFPVFQYRYGGGYRAMHELKMRGLLGKPYTLSLETHWQRGADYYLERWRGTWAGEMGGAIVSHACHAHNLMTHLAGNVAEVSALVDTRVNPIETEDCAAIIMRTVAGALVTSSVTLGSAGSSSRFRACFEHVTATSGVHPYRIGEGPWTFEATNPARQAEIDQVVASAAEPPARFLGFFTDIHAVLNGKEALYLTTMEEGEHSIELITAIYVSAREKRVVSLPLAPGHAFYDGWLPGA